MWFDEKDERNSTEPLLWNALVWLSKNSWSKKYCLIMSRELLKQPNYTHFVEMKTRRITGSFKEKDYRAVWTRRDNEFWMPVLHLLRCLYI